MVRNVLFVDDDQILQRAVEKGCAAHGAQFRLIFANDGFDAVKKLDTHSISLICSDLVMPRMDGPSLLAHVRDTHPDIPVIIISELGRDQVEHLIAAEGVAGYFKKPFLVEKLSAKILELLQEEASGGIMQRISPSTFMQLMEMEGKTCTIRMLDNHSGEGGILYMEGGKLLDARVGRHTGVDGAYRAFSWDEVTVFFRNECRQREDRIQSDLQALIMGALAAKDEREEAAAGCRGNDAAAPAPVTGTARGDAPGISPSGAADSMPVSQTDSNGPVDILRRRLSEQDGIEAIYFDETLATATEKLNRIGEQSTFGPLRAAYVMDGRGKNSIIVPGEPPTVIAGGPGLTVDKILKLLQEKQ